jgi:hypothetical protein
VGTRGSGAHSVRRPFSENKNKETRGRQVNRFRAGRQDVAYGIRRVRRSEVVSLLLQVSQEPRVFQYSHCTCQPGHGPANLELGVFERTV